MQALRKNVQTDQETLQNVERRLQKMTATTKDNECEHPVYVVQNGIAFCNECKKSWEYIE